MKTAISDKFGLSTETVNKINLVFTHFPQIEKVLIYGSRAKGNFKTGSDIDLTLLGGSELTTDILSALLAELDDLLLPYQFDLTFFDSLTDPGFIEHIQRVGRSFYEKYQ
jgi:predicted nucleotidyltransferase